MARAQYTASVTFESQTGPPTTVKVTVSAGSLKTAASGAVKAAQRAKPNQRWSSVVVLLERANA